MLVKFKNVIKTMEDSSKESDH